MALNAVRTSSTSHEVSAPTDHTEMDEEEEASQLAIWTRFCQKVHRERLGEATRPRYSMSTGRFVDAHIPSAEQPSPQPLELHGRQSTSVLSKSSEPKAGFKQPQASMRTTRSTGPKTRVTKKKKDSWSKHENDCCIKEMRRALKNDKHALIDELWESISERLQAIHGVDRSPWAVRNQWNRRLRYKSKLDERRFARSATLQTSLQ